MPIPFLIPTAIGLAPGSFDALISSNGQRASWMRSHTCPCVFAGGGPNGRLPQLGSAQRNCTKCFGVGTYWDAPSAPIRCYIEFMHMSPTSDEAGVKLNESFGVFQTSEPSLTIPYRNPYLASDDPGQPTEVWTEASTDDKFVVMDMLSRYTAVLQVGVKENLPFQQNLQIAPKGAVTVWDPVTGDVAKAARYCASGPTVTLEGYAEGTNYMVEFQAAPVYVVFRSAGGLPHVRPFAGGTLAEPRRFRLQALDFWTRERGIQPTAAGSVQARGKATPVRPAQREARVMDEPYDLEFAFAAGVCAAYDDLGIGEPQWYLGLRGPEIDAWKKGLESGYDDIDALMVRERESEILTPLKRPETRAAEAVPYLYLRQR